ncbi:hypothetical protein [Plantactinospora sp. CA-290183]|uniref:hypothetical protein n=1 Tax=Plantactinospora sp. CA-290183 TaxID=3240006 RepID=UPI003D8C442B
MLRWEYALLVRRRQPRLDEAGWELAFTWYSPDGGVLDVSPYGDTALAHLNRAGAQGWELVSVTEDPTQGSSELHRYHLKRPLPAAAPRPRIRGTGRRGTVG